MRFSRDSVAAMGNRGLPRVVILGFWKTRGPSTKRLIRGDERKAAQHLPACDGNQLAIFLPRQGTASGTERLSENTI